VQPHVEEELGELLALEEVEMLEARAGERA
jgi:hypothetical protein